MQPHMKEPGNMAKKPVLLVEDDPALRAVMGLVLQDAGYQVTAARDGKDALELLERETPGIILLDMRMPVMDGREFSRLLHQRPGPRVPVLTVTADTHPEQVAAEMEADGYIEKPFDIDELVEAVRELYPDR